MTEQRAGSTHRVARGRARRRTPSFAFVAAGTACLALIAPIQAVAPASVAHRRAERSKKGSRAWKRAHPWRRRVVPARVGQAPERVITFVHLHTGERLALGENERVPQALVDRFLRCRWTGRQIRMDLRPFRWVVAGAFRLGAREVHVISGFRHPKFNRVLWKKGRQVAFWSKHRLGQAIDFRLVGVPLETAYRYFHGLRLGGVGRYPESNFLHLDTGRPRTWNGR